jgi:cell division protein FtsB
MEEGEFRDSLLSRLHALGDEIAGNDINKPQTFPVLHEARNIAIALRMKQEQLCTGVGLTNRTMLTKAFAIHNLSWKLDLAMAYSISQLTFQNAALNVANEQLSARIQELEREADERDAQLVRERAAAGLRAELRKIKRARSTANLHLGRTSTGRGRCTTRMPS